MATAKNDDPHIKPKKNKNSQNLIVMVLTLMFFIVPTKLTLDPNKLINNHDYIVEIKR